MSFISNTTPTPNWLYNGEMKKMNDTDLRVVLTITRKTLGWEIDRKTGMRKLEDYVSQSQFVEMTGKSGRAIATAIQNCVEHGWIEGYDKNGNLANTPEKRARRKIYYRLGDIFLSKLSGEKNSQDKKKDKSGEVISKSGELNDTHLVKQLHSTKETITKETIQNLATSKEVAVSIVKSIDLFKEINPSYTEWYGNKTQRAALERLIAGNGEQKVQEMIQFAAFANTQEYAPVITTPYELEKNLGKLMAFFIRNKNKTAKTITI